MGVFFDEATQQPLRFFLPLCLPSDARLRACIAAGGGVIVDAFPAADVAASDVICVVESVAANVGRNVPLAVAARTLFDCEATGTQLRSCDCRIEHANSSTAFPQQNSDDCEKSDDEVSPAHARHFSPEQDAFIVGTVERMRRDGAPSALIWATIAGRLGVGGPFDSESVEARFQLLRRRKAAIHVAPIVPIAAAASPAASPKTQFVVTSPCSPRPMHVRLTAHAEERGLLDAATFERHVTAAQRFIDSIVCTHRVPVHVAYFVLHAHSGDVCAAAAAFEGGTLGGARAWSLAEDCVVLADDVSDAESDRLRRHRTLADVEARRSFLLRYKLVQKK